MFDDDDDDDDDFEEEEFEEEFEEDEQEEEVSEDVSAEISEDASEEDDSYTEESEQSWFSRIKDALFGIVIGLILFIVSFPLLFWNEGRAVKREQALNEGAGVVVSAEAARIDKGNEGKLIHLHGKAASREVLVDESFNVAANALKLARIVEMYQWEENEESKTEKKIGGGTKTVTKYTYSKIWYSKLIDSAQFKKPGKHRNPESMRFRQEHYTSGRVKLGAFFLSPGLIGHLDDYQRIPMTDATYQQVPTSLRKELQVHDGYYHTGSNPAKPRIGDLRISFESVKPSVITLVSQQAGYSFVPYRTEGGSRIELLEYGQHSAEEMFAVAQQENVFITWILRLVGLLLMFFGIRMILNVLEVLADVIPIFGNLVGAALTLISAVSALTLSLITVAIAWFFYRPILSAILIGAGVAILYALKYARRRTPEPEHSPATG
ncbi:MAG: hypothetical protein GY862_13850 [Gammaproteobacteria bacterium]|nr:hypothetical protein [Gammaproteobacteria bacterium]